ncbi:unnamed protein product [Blepharisma stoltei]|uniref:Uncharacterized protein n=1 Tax=Blepharisma stoltei TaxID=1481888 RepID=A0AAU9JBU9_9CILI|nr:unnamed protein product [Blepharisma stoltei]
MSHGERKIWNQMEDSAIQNLVEEFGEKNWILISEKLAEKYGITDRTGKQCRERWHNHINPKLKKGAWSKEEERILFRQQMLYGNRWSEIGKHLPGRSDNSIKNQFYSAIRKNLRKYNRNKPAAEQIYGSVKEILLDPEMAKILINYDEILNDKSKGKKKNKKRIRTKRTSITVEASSILHSLYDDSKEKAENSVSATKESRKSLPIKIENVKAVELKIDSATPISSINTAAPLTGYTPKFMKAHIFNFPDDALNVFNWDNYNNTDLDGIHGSDSLTLIPDTMPIQKSDSLQESLGFMKQMQSPHANSFILPPFSPMDSFQHYLTPRNNK